MPPARPHIRGDSPSALSGRLSAVSLFDLCQFLMLNRKTGDLTVRSGVHSAYITFLEGQLLNAVDENMREGESVVLRAVQWSEGSFEFKPGPVPPDRKIQASTENILLEAARKIDEMNAGDALEEDQEGGRQGGERTGRRSKEADYRETQERAAGLAEAFQRAMGEAVPLSSGTRWRDEVEEELEMGRVERLLLGPKDRVVLVSAGVAKRIEGVKEVEVLAWMDHIAPRRARGRLEGRILPGPTIRQTPFRNGVSLWAARYTSPAGDWCAVCTPQVQIPDLASLGLDPEHVRVMAGLCGGPILIQPLEAGSGDAPTEATPHTAQGLLTWPGYPALAAVLQETSSRNPLSGWVVEAWPRYDWSVLPGAIASIHPSSLDRPGRLTELIEASAADLLVLAGVRQRELILEAIDLAASDLRVYLLSSGIDPQGRPLGLCPAWAENLGSPKEGGPPTAATWLVSSGQPPTYLPLTAELLEFGPGV